MPSTEPHNAAEILCLGEAMVEFVRQPDGVTFRQGYGGDTSNAAIAAARQGGRVGYVTAVGTDRFGDDLVELWQNEGIATDLVRRDPEAPTGIYFVDPDPASRHFTYYRTGSAASRMASEGLDVARIGVARVLHLSGITLAVSSDLRRTAFWAADAVASAGGTVSLDTNLRRQLWSVDEARTHLQAAATRAGIIVTSVDDQQDLSGLSDPAEIAQALHVLGPGIVLVTLGGDGAWLSIEGQGQLIPAAPADPVDSTGAGDTFSGTFLTWWLETGDPVLAAHRASVAAAATVSALGAIPAIPDRDHVVRTARNLGRA